MNGRGLLRIIGFLLLGVGWGCTDDLTGPTEAPFCSSRPASAVATFEDANLEEAIRVALAAGPQEDLTCELLRTLTNLSAGNAGIESLSGIQNLTSLTTLRIRANLIIDISALSGLTSLTELNLAANSISDVSALSGLTNLTFLAINENGDIADISALGGLTSLTGTLWIGGNSITDLSALSELASLTTLNAWDNSITDLSGLSGLTGLRALRLHLNSITDLSALSGLTNLDVIWLHTNTDLSDIQPLIDNPGLGGAGVSLRSTKVSCTDVATLRGKGVSVIPDCPLLPDPLTSRRSP